MKRQCHPLHTESGFSLLEILVVLIVAGILAGIAAPSWLQYISNRRAQTVQTELKQLLQEAQTKARTTRQVQYVEIDEAAAIPTVKVGSDLSDLTSLTLGNGELKDGMVKVDINLASGRIAYDYEGAVQDGDLFYIDIIPSTGNRTYCLASLTLIGGVQSGADGECDGYETVVSNN
jgi:prepilin-type N-terminal cleavage/methylation domain-containing protein